MRTKPDNCTCVGHIHAPNCERGDSERFHRFQTYKIDEYQRDCPIHGYVFSVNLAADLRYGD